MDGLICKIWTQLDIIRIIVVKKSIIKPVIKKHIPMKYMKNAVCANNDEQGQVKHLIGAG